MNEKYGIILKGIGGFYYVKAADGIIYEGRARGVFRKNKLVPVPGDRVKISVYDQGISAVEEILPRDNLLLRPPIANLDKLIIVSSVCDPKVNIYIIDQLTVIAHLLNIKPVVVFSKSDLKSTDHLEEIYKISGIDTYSVSKHNHESILALRNMLVGYISSFVGNTGVGKSTIINNLLPELLLSTGNISKKLGRGKHTTRQVELFDLYGGGYIADTPGFSSVDVLKSVDINTKNLLDGFVELEKYKGTCKFNSCSHTCEDGCEIIKAVNRGNVHPSRYESYLAIYKKISETKKWK